MNSNPDIQVAYQIAVDQEKQWDGWDSGGFRLPAVFGIANPIHDRYRSLASTASSLPQNRLFGAGREPNPSIPAETHRRTGPRRNMLLLHAARPYPSRPHLEKGWYVGTSPIVTANWTAPSGNKWVTPIGSVLERVMRVERQPKPVDAVPEGEMK